MASFAEEADVTIKPEGYGGLEVGQIGKGFYKTSTNPRAEEVQHIWQQRAYCSVGYTATIKDRLDLSMAGGGLLAFSTPQIGSEPTTMQNRPFFYISKASAQYSFGERNAPFLQLQIGYFPFKYNPDVRNLGEYLFRTNTYPLITYCDFDYAKANLMGVRASTRLFNRLFTNDILLHSELTGVPVQDWSVSDIFSVNFRDIVSLGGGISFSHYFDVYQGRYPTTWNEPYYSDPAKLDSANMLFYRVVDGSDTAYLSWKGIKTMARLSFDPKKLIPFDVFGKNDLKIYFEGDVIGIKNYPVYYRHMEDRTIASAGFNVPGFKFVDLINVEGEFCSNRINADCDQNYFGGRPVVPKPILLKDISLKRNPWRWSVYIKKSFLNEHVSFITQVARDHKKINFYYFQKTYMSFIETLPDHDDWWWVFKTEFRF